MIDSSLFAGMAVQKHHTIQHPVDANHTTTTPYAELGPIEGEGDSARRRVTIGFNAGQGFADVRCTGEALSFDLVGTWELEEIGPVLVRLGQALSKAS